MHRLGAGCQNPHRLLSASDSFHANELGVERGIKKSSGVPEDSGSMSTLWKWLTGGAPRHHPGAKCRANGGDRSRMDKETRLHSSGPLASSPFHLIDPLGPYLRNMTEGPIP